MLNEELSAAQMKRREELVKGMKKNKDSFVAKYGDRAEEVMYATATKMAKQEITEMNTKTLVGHILSKNMVAAKETFNSLISAKVLTALGERKIQISKGMFSENRSEWEANRQLAAASSKSGYTHRLVNKTGETVSLHTSEEEAMKAKDSIPQNVGITVKPI